MTTQTLPVEVRRIRASSFPLLVACAASQLPGLQVDFSDAIGTQGQEIHRALALRLRGEVTPDLDTESEEMVTLGLDWVKSKGAMEPETELGLHDEYGSGTIDACWTDREGAAWVVDFKTGYRDDDFWPQTYRYAHLYFQANPNVNAINLCVVWLRKEGVDFKQVTRGWIDAWFREVLHNTIEHPDTYRPGEHCVRCSRRVDCPALAAVNRQSALALAGEPIAITLQNYPHFHIIKKQITQALKGLDEVRDALVEEHGSIPMGNGKELRKLEIHKTPISLMEALPVLQASGLSDETISGCCRISKTELMDAVGASAPKGGKKKSQDAIMDKLAAAGAVGESVEYQIRELLVK